MVSSHTIADAAQLGVEESARLAFEDRLGRQLSEQEWTSYRSRLVAFFQLLRSWEERPSSGV
jgi:hypothetical protein